MRIRTIVVLVPVLAATILLAAAPRVNGQRPGPTLRAPEYSIPPSPVPWRAPVMRETMLPINLPTALRLVNARTLDVAVASKRIMQASAQFDRAQYAWLPTITLGADYMRHDGLFQEDAGNIINPTRSSFMAGLGVNAILTPADAIWAPLAARQVVRSRQFDHEAAENNTVLAVAEAYFGVQQARGELAGAEVAVQHAEELLRRAEKLAPGLVPPVEAIRARSELAQRKQAVHAAQERWRLASADLIRILRLDPSALIDPIEPPHLQVSLISLDHAIDTLIPVGLRHRPELASQQALIEATLQRLKEERLRPLIPSLVLRGPGSNAPGSFNGGLYGGGNDAVGHYGARSDVEVQVIWEFQNLLLGNASKIKERQADRQVAVLEGFRLQDRIAAEIVRAHAQAMSAADRLGDAESGLKDAADSVDKNFQGLNQTRRAGELIILMIRPQEVVAAIQTLAQAYGNYYGAVADFNRAQFRLYRALGYPAQFVIGHDSACLLPPVTSERAP